LGRSHIAVHLFKKSETLLKPAIFVDEVAFVSKRAKQTEGDQIAIRILPSIRS
jgi:hypothetical protein